MFLPEILEKNADRHSHLTYESVFGSLDVKDTDETIFNFVGCPEEVEQRCEPDEGSRDINFLALNETAVVQNVEDAQVMSTPISLHVSEDKPPNDAPNFDPDSFDSLDVFCLKDQIFDITSL